LTAHRTNIIPLTIPSGGMAKRQETQIGKVTLDQKPIVRYAKS
jgi:hypothetical protein